MNKNNIYLKVLDFSEYPGPRFKSQGDSSGEEYFESILKPNFEKVITDSTKLFVDLDGTAGYASSFIDEAFGKLVMEFGIDIVKSHLEVISNDEKSWLKIIWEQSVPQWESKRTTK